MAALALISGCAAKPVPVDDHGEDFSATLASAIAEAEAGGGSQQQLDILTRALDSGKVSFEDASAANEATVECLNDSGISANVTVEEIAPGYELPGFTASLPDGMTPESSDVIITGCENRESFYVNFIYQTQPAAVQSQNAEFERHRPEFVACLVRNGHPIDDTATLDELMRAGTDVMTETSETNDLVNCWTEAGIGPG